MKTKIRRGTWNTYAITGYTHQVGTDASATGGVHVHAVRRGRSGWQKRTSDSTGRFESHGPVTPIAEDEGEALFARAETR
jgi:hypothetical protein